ncbi:FGGY-family carbohydrate kinase [Aestuariivirga litoralis]|uniref:FGGY-family carbohydrate kinase n=1 Tax=Aestuariivirga litoralis TaxID=2650924 RepID=UPI0018C4CA46|nr:FGGY-family carbohydrate kinase [Aestuariivirga litoralis]MBG1232529.1 carbohydrate kinase [Aestuariivirga litoralis]
MSSPHTKIAVIDIGKTNAKLVLFDFSLGKETWSRRMANAAVKDGLYPHHDVDGLWRFILASLQELARDHQVDAISITTHGASGVLLAEDGSLAMPALDYEHIGIDDTRAAYDKVRPPFAETGSPGLHVGLNLGAQIFWQAQTFPEAFAKTRWIVMYAQYWSYLLSGVIAGEVTSIGCHTDLWAPAKADYSSMVDALGWRRLMPPIRKASDCLGPITEEVADATGLPADTPVYCGIHDSNASLYPHLFSQKLPFAVVSTGTWVINMAMGGKQVELDAARDTLINVNAMGQPTPTARFMGGREFQILMEGNSVVASEADAARVVGDGVMLLPAVVEGFGPYQGRKAEWINADGITPGERRVAASYYLGLMTAKCLELIGADGPVLVEGPFASNAHLVAMLSAATGREVLLGAAEATGTSLGAALLANPAAAASEPARRVKADGAALKRYAAQWTELLT